MAFAALVKFTLAIQPVIGYIAITSRNGREDGTEMSEPTTIEIPNLQQVESSMFSGVAFDESHWTLTVVFKSGAIIAYQNVGPEVYEEFMAAPSLGKFYNSAIKGKYESLTVQEAHKVEKSLVVNGKAVKADADLSQKPVVDAVTDAALNDMPTGDGGITAKTFQEAAATVAKHGIAVREMPWDEISSANSSPAKNSLPAGSGCQICGSPEGHPDAVCPETANVEPEMPMQDCYVHMGPTPHWKRPDGSLVCEKCHPNPSSKPQDAPEGLSKAPTILPPLEAPKTPQEAIALLSKNDGEIQATIRQNRELAEESLKMAVSDAKTYTTAGDRLKFLTEAKDRAFKFLDPIRAVLLKPYQMAQQRLKEATDPIDTALAHLKRQRIVWESAEEDKRRREQERLRQEQEAEAERLRQEQSQQLTLGAVDEALATGDTETAEKLIAEPIQTPPQYLPPVHIESSVPKVEGVSRRAKWVAEITNFEDLVLDIASGICSMRDGKTLAGHAPVTFLKPDMTAINQSAKSQRQSMGYPGVKAYDEGSEVVRRAK